MTGTSNGHFCRIPNKNDSLWKWSQETSNFYSNTFTWIHGSFCSRTLLITLRVLHFNESQHINLILQTELAHFLFVIILSVFFCSSCLCWYIHVHAQRKNEPYNAMPRQLDAASDTVVRCVQRDRASQHFKLIYILMEWLINELTCHVCVAECTISSLHIAL